MSIFYVDLENGNDSNNGLSFANRKLTLGSISPGRGDEIRVMASEPATSIGNATWTQQPVGAEVGLGYVYDESGAIRVTFSTVAPYLLQDSYVVIKDSSTTALNGLWKASPHASGGILLYDSNFSVLGVTNGTNVSGSAVNITGKLVRISGELVNTSLNPPSWDSVTIANPVSDWVAPEGVTDGVSNGSSFYSGGNTFKSYPGSSWRLTWNSSNNDVIVTPATYVDNRNNSGSWSNSYSNYYGTRYSSAYIGFGYNARHLFGGYTSYYGRVGAGSWIQFGTYSTSYSSFNLPNRPPARHYKIGSKDATEMYRVRYKYANASNSASWSDLSSTTDGYLVWYEGNRNSSANTATTYSNYSDTRLSWTAWFSGPAGSNKTVQIDIHENPGWQQVTIEPGTETVAGYYDNGTKFNCGGSPANSTLFWHNFSSPVDLSSFDSISFFMKVSEGVFSANEWKLRIHQGAYNSGAAYDEFDLDLANTGPDFKAFGFDNGSALPNNVGAVSIVYTGSSAILGLQGFVISNLMATSSTGINFSTLIGRNTAESPHWYKVSALRYFNQETLISLGGYDGQLESDPGGMAYYGSTSRSTCPDLDDNTQVSSDTVTTYVRTPIQLSNYVLLQYGDEQLKIRGGWNRTDMSTQDGDTMLATPNQNTDGIVVSGLKACYLENFYVHGGRYGIYVYSVATGTEVVNCRVGYTASWGIYVFNSNSCIIKNCSVLGGGHYGITLEQSASCDIRNTTLDGCKYGIHRGKAYSYNNDTYDCVIRGSIGSGYNDGSMNLYEASECYDYNPYILSHGNIYVGARTANSRVYGGKLVFAEYTNESAKATFYNYNAADVAFEKMDNDQISNTHYREASTYHRSDGSVLVTQLNGETYQYWVDSVVALRKASNISSGTLPDGSSDPGNTVYRFELAGYGYKANNYYPNFNIRGPRFSFGEIPCTAGTQLTISLKAKDASSSGSSRLFFRCDAAQSTIGLDEDVLEHWKTSGNNQWTTYSTTINVPESGLACCYMYYTHNSSSSGSTSYVYFTDIEVSSI